jgi:hypothetical protein
MGEGDSPCLYACLEKHYISFLKFKGLEDCISCSGNGEVEGCEKKLLKNKKGWEQFYEDLRIYNRAS